MSLSRSGCLKLRLLSPINYLDSRKQGYWIYSQLKKVSVS